MKKPILALSTLLLLGTLAGATSSAQPASTPKPVPSPSSKAQPAKPQPPKPSERPPGPGKKWDLTLDEAVSLALRQNPDVLHAKQEIERTRGVVIEVRAQALPQAVVTSAYNQQDINLLRDTGGGSSGGGSSSKNSSNSNQNQVSTSGSSSQQAQKQSQSQGETPSFTPQTKTWNVTLTGKQLLYSGGSVGAAIKIARFTQDSSYFSLRETIDAVIARTRTFFCQALVNRELITVQEESVRLLQDQLKDQQIRFEAGTVPRFNVLQAEVALSNEIPNLINAKNAYLISQLNLAKVLGVDYGGATAPVPFNVVGQLDIEERPISLEQGTAIARAQRAIMKVRRQAILIQVENIKVALAGYKPTLSAQGGYEVRNSRASNSLSDTVNGWFFGVTGSWDIFDGFATYGRAKQARASLEEARIDYNDTWHFVELEVQQAYANLQQAKELMASQEKNVEQAQEAVRLATERLAAGAGTQLDVLSQTVALTTAQTTRLQARSQYIQALADYDRATGYITRYEETFDDPVVEKMRKALAAEMPPVQPQPAKK